MPIYTLKLHPRLTYAFNANALSEQHQSDDSVPSDISESELVGMLTECFAIAMAKRGKQFDEAMGQFDPDAVLPPIPKRKRE
jgi:hypothetical protein